MQDSRHLSDSSSAIRLRGVHVHNLRGINVDIPHEKLTVLTGVSGSGKSSLAIDTLYAEGQRRYVESFSTKARQYLDRLDKPDVSSIEDLLPAVAVRQNSVSRSPMATVGSETGIDAALQLLFGRLGKVQCPGCNLRVKRISIPEAVRQIEDLPAGSRAMLTFALPPLKEGEQADDQREQLLKAGFTRELTFDRTRSTCTPVRAWSGRLLCEEPSLEQWIVADRIIAGKTEVRRLTESVETCYRFGKGRCTVLYPISGDTPTPDCREQIEIEGTAWSALVFSNRLQCVQCGRSFQEVDPRRLNFQSPLGACGECGGRGTAPLIDWQRLVPDVTKSIEDNAIVLLAERRWNRHRQQIIHLCQEAGIDTSRPFKTLNQREQSILCEGREGASEEGFAGLRAVFQRETRSSLRDDIERWAPQTECKSCQGTRLQAQAQSVRLDGKSISDFARMPVCDARDWLEEMRRGLPITQKQIGNVLISDLRNRLGFLAKAGLDYLETARAMSALSLGEARRVGMTAAVGSSLVNALFVLDEPSAGQHPRDCERLLEIVRQIRDSGNTVVAVDHQPAFIEAADFRIELGPGAGRNGGTVTFAGTSGESVSVTQSEASRNEHSPAGSIRIEGCTHNTLKDVTAVIPLGCLCVVTGVSGSGKSSLIEKTLYPALCNAIGLESSLANSCEYSRLSGAEQIGDVQLVSAERLVAGRRSSPATWLKVFDGIRQLFAETQEAVSRKFTASTFSFNTDSGGRCTHCKGTGTVEIDMQFLSDVVMTCPDCHGTRFQREILEVTWRGQTVADVLAMTAEEAFSFFRGQRRIQKKLQSLKEVGLGYLTLGQPLLTLSGGEAQRLKLASSLAATGKTKSLLILAEPATGLHESDTQKLLRCFDQLLGIGHSLLVIEHNLQLIRAADHIIDIGPEAGPGGGQIVATGTVEQIRNCAESLTGKWI